MKGYKHNLFTGLKVSIITPSFNHGRFIESTILSVKNQDYLNIEHIIIDGGSTDNTLDILKKYESTYNMRWVLERDRGQADAINKGFKMSNGDILCWLNSDDVYLSDFVISQIVSIFHIYPDADVVTANGMFISVDGQWVQPIVIKENHISYKYLRYADTILQPATFIKRKIIEKELLDISMHYAFDWDFFIRISKFYNILPTNLFVAGYRVYPENKTSSGGAKRAKEIVEITRRYLGRSSWQYYVVYIFYILYLFDSKLPKTFRNRFAPIIKKLSKLISILTYNRVTDV